MNRIAFSLAILACALLPITADAAARPRAGLKLTPFIKDPKGLNEVSSGFVNVKKRLVLAAGKNSGANDPGVAGAKILGIPGNFTGESFYLQFDINPKAFEGENAPYWEVTATKYTDSAVTGQPSVPVDPPVEYIRRFYLPIGHHAVPDPTRSYSVPLHTVTSDKWDTFAYNHHGCFDENDQGKTLINHPDHITSMTFVYNQPAASGQTNYAMIDNVYLVSPANGGNPIKEVP